MPIYRTSRELPKSLNGYALWLQLQYAGQFQTVCGLRPTDARAALRWADSRTLPVHLRVWGERI